MKTLIEDKFDNIQAVITNSRLGIEWDLMDKRRKRMYREILRKNNNIKGNLDNDIINKSIYVFSQC